MRLHSVAAAITNSSTELFVVDEDISAEEVYRLAEDLWRQLQEDPASLGASGYEAETVATLASREWGRDARHLLGELKTYTPPPILGHCPHCGGTILEGGLEEGYEPWADDHRSLVDTFGEGAVPVGRLYATFATDEGGYPYALINALAKKLKTLRWHS